MTKSLTLKLQHSLHRLSKLEVFQLEKALREILGSNISEKVEHAAWRNGSVVMYYDFDRGALRSGIIRRIDPAVVTVLNATSGTFETVPSGMVEKIPRGYVADTDVRERHSLATRQYKVGQTCATVTKDGNLEIGIIEAKKADHLVLLCDGRKITVPHGEYWRALGIEL